MAVRVKVQRLKLLARLEEVRDKAKKDHTAALKKFIVDRDRARNRAARDLRKKANQIVANPDIYVGSTEEYRGEKRVRVLAVESNVKIPRRPEEHRALRDIERAIALLDQSDDERISISTDDTRYYGIGSIMGLED